MPIIKKTKTSDHYSSKYKGVRIKRGAVIASPKIDGVETHLGTFATEAEAAIAYDNFIKNKFNYEYDPETYEQIKYKFNFGHPDAPETKELRSAAINNEVPREKVSLKRTALYQGVRLKNGKFVAEININRGRTQIGTFLTQTEAAIAYDNAVQKEYKYEYDPETYHTIKNRFNFGHPDDPKTEERRIAALANDIPVASTKVKTSRYRGVSKNNKGKFVAVLKIQGKAKNLGAFDTQHEAALAYDKYVQQEFKLKYNPATYDNDEFKFKTYDKDKGRTVKQFFNFGHPEAPETQANYNAAVNMERHEQLLDSESAAAAAASTLGDDRELSDFFRDVFKEDSSEEENQSSEKGADEEDEEWEKEEKVVKRSTSRKKF